MNEPIITLNNISKSYGKKKVIENMTLEFQKGQSVVLAGQNGAGKSTLLRCMSGVSMLDRGEVRCGYGITKKQIGFISDGLSLFENWSLQQGIEFHCRVFGIKEFDDKLIQQIGLNRKDKIKNLSAGQRVIYHLSLILSQKPELLLIDEIIHLIDPYIRELLLESLIEAIDSLQTTLIMVNHTFTETEKIPERILIMEEGKFILDEPTEQLKSRIRKVVTEIELSAGMPCIFKKETGTFKEYFIYPFQPELATKFPYDYLILDLNDIVKAFIGGSYDKKRSA